MQSITYQPQLRRALPLVNGPKEYREQRDLFIRLDGLLHQSDLEGTSGNSRCRCVSY
jgi:hypothetical protein